MAKVECALWIPILDARVDFLFDKFSIRQILGNRIAIGIFVLLVFLWPHVTESIYYI